MSLTINGREYVTGLCRNSPATTVAHLYDGTMADPGQPMCVRGWNRGNGFGYSIFRNNVGDRGLCQVCVRRAQEGRPSVPPRRRTTRWL